MSRFRKYMLSANWLKTIVFNFKMFPFRQAIHLPVLLFGNVDIKDCQGGKCEFIQDIPSKDLFAQVIIGNVYCHLWGRNVHPYFTRLSIKGVLKFGEEVFISGGGLIYVHKNATLSIGNQVYIAPKVRISCWNKISIDANVRFAWECQVFDTNFHYMVSKDGITRRLTKPIQLHHNGWIGNRVTIMPGAELGAFSTIASNSLLNKDYSNFEGCIFAGSPAKLVKEGCYKIINYRKELELNDYFMKNKDVVEYSVGEMNDKWFVNR